MGRSSVSGDKIIGYDRWEMGIRLWGKIAGQWEDRRSVGIRLLGNIVGQWG